MQEVLISSATDILSLVVTVVVPSFAAFLGKMIRDWIKSQAKKVDNEYVRTMIEDVGDTVEAAVLCTSQTYVNDLKDKDMFGKDEQKAAFQKTYDTVMAMLNDDAKALIVKTHGDVKTYITTQIEALVEEHKLDVRLAGGK